MRKGILLLFIGLASQAAELPQPKYESYYTDSSGNRVATAAALIRSVGGETMFKCQTIEAKVSKSQTSIGIRAVKKPKAGGK